MLKTRVLVLRGGPSAEYDVSLQTGQAVLAHLPPDKYQSRDILIDKQGTWHMRGVPIEPVRALAQADVVFNALHGTYGEDGTVQRLLDAHSMPYTGSGVLASAMSLHKSLAKAHLTGHPFRLPHQRLLTRDMCTPEVLSDLFRTFPQPSIVKPISGGSSRATHVVHSFDSIVTGVTAAVKFADAVLVEQFVPGREATVVVTEDFRGEPLYVFPPIEVTPTHSSFYDATEKSGGHARVVCPAPFTGETKAQLCRAARSVHHTLGLRDYSRSDFIVNKHGVYFLEVNALPGLGETALVRTALEAVGALLPDFLDHIVTLARARQSRARASIH